MLDLTSERRTDERVAEARRLVRELLATAVGLGISAHELRAVVDSELNGRET